MGDMLAVQQRHSRMLPSMYSQIFNPYPNTMPINTRRRRRSTDSNTINLPSKISDNHLDQDTAQNLQILSQKITIKIDRQTNMITIKKSAKKSSQDSPSKNRSFGRKIFNVSSKESRSLPEYVRQQNLYDSISVHLEKNGKIVINLPEELKEYSK